MRTACDLLPESVEVLSRHSNIVGIKEAIDDSQRIKELIQFQIIVVVIFQYYSGDDPTFMNSLEYWSAWSYFCCCKCNTKINF